MFATLEQLAGARPVELATMDIRWTDQDPCTFSGRAHQLDGFVRDGPSIVFPRMVLGARLLDLMGGTLALEQCTAQVRALMGCGGVAFDLIVEPWSADPGELKRAQALVQRQLRLAGMLAVDTDELETIAAPRWKPPHSLQLSP